ncbi:hypothetical protein [Paucilactobacillus sp. N302-9]
MATFSIIVSIVSVFIAALSFLKNKSELLELRHPGDSDWSAMTMGEISYINDKGRINPLPDGLLVKFQFLNPSPNDVAYFHLHFTANNRAEDVWTHKTVSWDTEKPKFIIQELNTQGEINLLKNVQGIFPAHSFTPVYAFMSKVDGPFPDKITFTIKYAVRKFPYIGKKNRYTTYQLELNTFDFEKKLREKHHIVEKMNEPQIVSNKKQPTSKKHKQK